MAAYRGALAGSCHTRLMATVPDTIDCIECGGTCHRLSHEPDVGFAPGDVVAYRCADCQDRFDVVVPADAEDDAGDPTTW